MQAFRILYEDEALVAIDKPAGFHSHPPEDKSIFLPPRWDGLRILQNQLGLKLYPAHRLDRATSGVLLFSKQRECNDGLQSQFREGRVRKTYYCLVRGEFQGAHTLDSPMKTDSGSLEPAVTQIEALATFRLSLPSRPDQAFTVVHATPETGKYHQIRRHLARISHPIVGDKQHGDKKMNREFKAVTGLDRLFLRCVALEFAQPASGSRLNVRARWTKDWHNIFMRAGMSPVLH